MQKNPSCIYIPAYIRTYMLGGRRQSSRVIRLALSFTALLLGPLHTSLSYLFGIFGRSGCYLLMICAGVSVGAEVGVCVRM